MFLCVFTSIQVISLIIPLKKSVDVKNMYTYVCINEYMEQGRQKLIRKKRKKGRNMGVYIRAGILEKALNNYMDT